MSKIIIFIYLFISLFGGISFADSDYKIVVKVNDEIREITNSFNYRPIHEGI